MKIGSLALMLFSLLCAVLLMARLVENPPVADSITISGNAGYPGATLSYTVGVESTVTADWEGYYTLTVPSGWSGSVTPRHASYIFTPPARFYSNVTADQTGQDYAVPVCPAPTAVDPCMADTEIHVTPDSEPLKTGEPVTYTISVTTRAPYFTGPINGYVTLTSPSVDPDERFTCAGPLTNGRFVCPNPVTYREAGQKVLNARFDTTAESNPCLLGSTASFTYAVTGVVGEAPTPTGFCTTETRIRVTAGSEPSVIGQPVSYSVSVAAQDPEFQGAINGHITLTGRTDDPKTPFLCAGEMTNGSFTCPNTVTYWATGVKNLNASFDPTGQTDTCSLLGSIATATHTVNRSPTRILYTLTPTFPQVGQAFNLKVMVQGDPPGAGTPSGSVDLFADLAGTQDMLTLPLDDQGAAVVTFMPSIPGMHSIVIGYPSAADCTWDPNYEPSSLLIPLAIHPATVTISGSAGVGGATVRYSVRYSDGDDGTVTAGSDGSYTLSVPYGWSGSVTPSKDGYSFAPDHMEYSQVTGDQAAQNYQATAHHFLAVVAN